MCYTLAIPFFTYIYYQLYYILFLIEVINSIYSFDKIKKLIKQINTRFKLGKKLVYIGLTADTIHHGHINLIERGRDFGEIIVGLLTDKAVSDYKEYFLA